MKMRYVNRSSLYKEALKKWGPEAQMVKLTEETGELVVEAARCINGVGNEVALASKMADVEIMIEQFRLNGMATLIDYQKEQKLQRLVQRLGVEYSPEKAQSQAEALAYTRGYQDRCDELAKAVGGRGNE